MNRLTEDDMIEQRYLAQLERHYTSFLKNEVMGVPFHAIALVGGKGKPETTVDLHGLTRLFQQYEKREGRKGWVIDWEDWTSKKFGRQKWPAALRVETEEDFLWLLKKEAEVAAFKEQLAVLLCWSPAVRDWLAGRPRLVLELKASWKGIMEVVDFLLMTDVSGQYLRALPVPVHTKFIQQHKRVILSLLQCLDPGRFPADIVDLEEGLSLRKKPYFFTARWLDPSLADIFSAGMDSFGTTVDYLKGRPWVIKQVLLVENETNLYMLPPLAGTLVIWSSGKALHLLKEVPFLQQTKLYYWGDLDEEGFAMLNAIRGYYGHVRSLFMDSDTVGLHQSELSVNPVLYKRKTFPRLEDREQGAYEFLLVNNQWLEQERLDQGYVSEVILALLA